MNVRMPVVDFFLDEEASPMTLCVVHDADGESIDGTAPAEGVAAAAS